MLNYNFKKEEPSRVTTWIMPEEQRLAYIEKYPIIPYDERGKSYAQLDEKLARRTRKPLNEKKTKSPWHKMSFKC